MKAVSPWTTSSGNAQSRSTLGMAPYASMRTRQYHARGLPVLWIIVPIVRK